MKHTIWALGVLTLSAGILPAAVLTENFDDVTTLAGSGWAIVNESTPVGTTDWFQGNSGIFGSQAGAPDSYVAANFNAADFSGNINNWLMTPELTLTNGLTLSFFTRTEDAPIFADLLEILLSTAGSSTSTADFTTLMLTINPLLNLTDYPSTWTQYTATVSGLGGPATGRFAFHYNVPDTSVNGDYIGIDTVSVDAAGVPEPSTWALVAAGLALAGRFRRKR